MQKDVESGSAPSSASTNLTAVNNGNTDTLGRWFGTYHSPYGDPDSPLDTIPENVLIKNGEASIPEIDSLDIGDYYEVTSIGYYMPPDKLISGDSIIFTARVRDDANVAQLDITGTQNIAHATCEKTGVNSSTLTLTVGQTSAAVTITPAIDFTAYKIMSLVLRGNRALLFIPGNHTLAVIFNKEDKIGNIKILSIGYHYQPQVSSPYNRDVECAGIALFNSYTAKLLVRETFSTDGKSSTIFF